MFVYGVMSVRDLGLPDIRKVDIVSYNFRIPYYPCQNGTIGIGHGRGVPLLITPQCHIRFLNE